MYTGNAVRNYLLHQKMMQYAAASGRGDGAANRVVMNGKDGFLGYSSVRLSYLTDGWISLVGENIEDSNGWKLIATFTLEPGSYTLTGMTGQAENTIALQLHIEDDTGFYRYLYQYDENVIFQIERSAEVTLHVRVYPHIETVDVTARPAVYKDE